jgi:hypothetical protein
VKRLGAGILAAVVLVSCGGSGESPSNDAASTVAPSTAGSSNTSTTEAPSNTSIGKVPDTGFGENGSGVARAVLEPVVNDVVVAPRLFRRDSRDVFVGLTTARTVGTQTTVQLHVYGFNTTAENERDYPLLNFGNEGVVVTTLPERDGSVAPVPVGFSVVSKRTAVVLLRGTGDTVGVLEYHDLKSGTLDTRYGTEGRVTLTREATGMTRVLDVVLRAKNEAGLAQVVVLGTAVDDAGAVTDVRVMGVGPDGKADPVFGDGGAVSWLNVDGVRNDAAVSLTQLADLGDDPKGERIAAVGLRQVGDNGTDLITMVSQAPGENGVVGRVDGRVLQDGFAYGTPLRLTNATLASPTFNYLDNEVAAVLAGEGNDVVLTRRVRWGSGVLRTEDAMVNQPFGPIADRARHVVPMPDVRGKWLSAAVLVKNGNGDNVLKVCFEFNKCNYPTVFSLTVLDAAPPQPAQLSLRASSDGVVALVSPLGGTGDGASLVGFDLEGVPSSPRKVDAVLWGQTLSPTGYLDSSVAGPLLADASTVVSVGADYTAHPGIDFMRVVRAGDGLMNTEPVDSELMDVAVTASLQNVRYSAAAKEVAPLDGESAVVVGHVWEEGADGAYVERTNLYKVSLRNGSTLTPFGSGDHVTVPTAPTEPSCANDVAVQSDAGGAGVVVEHYGLKKAKKGELAECDWATPRSVSFGFVAASGVTSWGDGNLPNVTLSPDDAATVGDVVSQHVDATGALFTLRRGTTAVPSQPWFDTPLVSVQKWGPAGKLDTGFGDNGLVQVAGAGWNPYMTIDAESRVYVGWLDVQTEYVVTVVRLRADGTLDTSGDVGQDSVAPETDVDVAKLRYDRRLVEEEMRAEVEMRNAATEEVGLQSRVAMPALNVFGSKPVVIRVSSPADNALLVEWASPSTVKGGYVVATALPNGRGCSTLENSCLIRGLSALQAYRVVLSGQRDDVPPIETSTYPAVKPSRVLKTGRVVSLTSVVRPAVFVPAKDVKWKVAGDCTISLSGKELETPDTPGECTVSVTTPKVGNTPKTTRTVTVHVIQE